MQFYIYWRKKHDNFSFDFFTSFCTYWILFWITGIEKQTDAAAVLKPRDHSDFDDSRGAALSSPFICSLVNELVN